MYSIFEKEKKELESIVTNDDEAAQIIAEQIRETYESGHMDHKQASSEKYD